MDDLIAARGSRLDRPQAHGGCLKSGSDRRRPRARCMARAWIRAWAKTDRRQIYEWAREHVYIPRGVYTISGQFDVSLSRWMIKPFEALRDPAIRKVTLMAPPRSGKSLVADVLVPWILANDPGPIMWNMNTDPLAKRHMRTRIIPLLKRCGALRDLLPADTRKINQELICNDGTPFYLQGPSIGNLQGVPVRWLIEDELWMRDEGKHEQALSRLDDYVKLGNDKCFNIGQAGWELDAMDLEYRAGTMEEWFVPCRKCGHVQELVFSGTRPDGTLWGMRWDDNEKTRDKHGDWIPSQVIPTIRWECFKCGHAHLDGTETKDFWNAHGDYVATNPAALATARSFHINNVLLTPWRSMVTKFCEAQNALRTGSLEPLIIFTQKDEARSWSDQRFLNSKPTPTYELGKDRWKDAVYRFITVDRQKEGLMWLLVCDWSARGEMRPLWYGKVHSEAEVLKKQAEFGVRPNNVFLDSGHEATVVYGMCVRNGWIALKGEDKRSFTHQVLQQTKKGPVKIFVERSYAKPVGGDPEAGKIGQARKFATLILWSNPTIKNRSHRQRDRGLVVFPVGAPRIAGGQPEELEWVAELKKQMSGEWKKRIRNQLTGKFKEVWCDNGNNHGADCWFMQTLAATLAKILKDNPVEEESAELVVTE